MRPTITGPHAWPAAGPPPRFAVDTADLPLYTVELARSQCLVAGLTGRTGDNYFFGGDADNAFATGPCWRVPATVWARLRHSPALYYRVVAVDPVGGTPRPSVADEELHLLPVVRIEPDLRVEPDLGSGSPSGGRLSRRSR